jgi:hypothetical protein
MLGASSLPLPLCENTHNNSSVLDEYVASIFRVELNMVKIQSGYTHTLPIPFIWVTKFFAA